MPLKELLQAIRRQAAEEAESIVGPARDEAARMLEAAKIGSEAIREAARGEALAPAGADREQLLSRFRVEGEAALSAALQGQLMDLETAAAKAIGEIRARPEYRATLRNLIQDALAVIGQQAKVRVAPSDEAQVRHEFADDPRVGNVSADETIVSGAIIEAADASVLVDQRLESRLSRLLALESPQILDLLQIEAEMALPRSSRKVNYA